MRKITALILFFACFAAIVSFSGCSLEDSAANGYYITEIKSYNSEGDLSRHDFYYYNSDMQPVKIDGYRDGKLIYSAALSYDEQGNMILRSANDIEFDSSTVQSFEYDDQGRIIKDKYISYSNANRDNDYSSHEYSYEYLDSKGNYTMSGSHYLKMPNDNELHESTYSSTDYVDAYGAVYKSVIISNGTTEELTYENTYEDGKLISQSNDSETINYYYDENGNKIKEEYINKEQSLYNYIIEYFYSKTPTMLSEDN